ncbi:DNA-directed RNA polymerase [Geobacter sp. SVR]|uniref:DNA-directed RNA polymerase n=1 Tax=Geobacter sp. SVR TaxID=2495594 RepID=UPI00143EFBD7|nr:DNA-directed RNA polymerase [Geobacter sp. SVR]BCS53333.1 DNA-directed RNA polymerase [Geobacter sp. SVR]GCF85541.1 DNA-directed RNA polymerase [Geobacter sp. SVR]
MQQSKLQQQIELEFEGVQAGVNQYRKQLQSGVTDLPPGVAIMKKSMEPMTEAIEDFLKPTRGSQKMHQVRQFLTKLKVTPEELAYLTLKECMNALTDMVKLQTTALNLTRMVMDQHEYAKFRSSHKGYVSKMEQDLRMASFHHKRTVVMLKKRKMGIDDDRIEQEERLIIGCKLIELCILSTGLIERTMVNDRYYLTGTEKAVKWVERVNERCELLSPSFMPMVVSPKPWEGVEGGGYLSNSASLRFKLIKTRNKKALSELGLHRMDDVYHAMNTVQETPWRINKRLFEVASVLWEGGSTLADLPAQDKEDLPPKPWSSDEEFERLKQVSPEVVTEWKRKAATVHEEFLRNKSKRTAVCTKLRLASRFADEPEIYFPHVLDWRGRLYPVPNQVNPQSDDLGKGLLQFAQGKPLGATGLKWLKIHLANTYGVDKVSFEDRIKWVDEHEREITDSAENPLDGQRFWCAVDENGKPIADSPFCFLAACFEYAQAHVTGCPEAFVSYLPIAQDGTCSGLQHFSAMLKDSVGGAAVNLLPAEHPQDIYQRVAALVNEMVNRDAAEGCEEAKLWQGKVDRGIAKRAVMTSPYGAKKYGFKDQLLQELRKRGSEYLGTKEVFQACIYLAERLWEAIGQVVIAARDAMDWLQEVAKVCAEVEIPVWWTTPVGFRAHQEYLRTLEKRIDTFWGGTYVRLTLASDTNKMDNRKQANGIAPNFVHSMDASHLMRTVLRCKEQGITDFAMIHDSFGTHACNVDTLAAILRETFVEQYSENVLENFRSEILGQLPEEHHWKIPKVPPMGDLDLATVKGSLYFFA